MHNNSYAPHYAIIRYSIREFKTGAEPFMVAIIIIIIIRNNEGQTNREFNHSPILNTKVYNVMFPYGAVHQYVANTIAYNIYSQVDEDDHRYQLMYHISNHMSDGISLPKSEAFMVSRNGNRNHKINTKGWYLEVQWKDGTNSWVPLRIKESHGIQTAEYAEAHELIN